MMVDGAEEGQLKGPIDVLAPYSFFSDPRPPGLVVRGARGSFRVPRRCPDLGLSRGKTGARDFQTWRFATNRSALGNPALAESR